MRRHLVDTSEGALHFISEGDSASDRTVLFFHQSPSSSRMWAGVMAELGRRGVGSIAGDMFDYGMSDRSTTQLDLHSHAAFLVDAASEIVGGDLIAVGHHTGAVFAASAASQRDLHGLLVMGYPLYSSWREKYERLGGRIHPDRYGSDGAELAALWVELNASIEPDTPFGSRHLILVDRLAAGPIWYTAYAALLQADIQAVLESSVSTGVPVAAVFAHDDAISRFEPGVTAVTGGEPIWIDGGPWVTIEHPDRVADVVEQFVGSVP